jgi:aspartyl-tRNA(Asn)/glutamyl-tRNA(Gln) amidotransferase subunit C
MAKTRTKLSSKQIEHIGQLANLPLKDKEVNKFRKQLSNVFNYVDELTQLNTKGVTQTSHVTGLVNRVRADKAETENCLTQKEALQPSSKKNKGFFIVKAIIKEQ